VLLLNQGGSPGVASASNGVWIWNGNGNAMSRPTATNDYVHGATLDNETVTRVSQGSTMAHTEWSCVTSGTLTVDTTAIAHSPQKPVFNIRDTALGVKQLADQTRKSRHYPIARP
jgi:hypothetical protein